MRKRSIIAFVVLALVSGVVLAQTSRAPEYLNFGFQALLYHAVRIEESFPRINPLGLAIDEFSKAIKVPAQAGEANLMLGLVYSYLQRPGTALGYYLEFAHLHPEEGWVHALIGDLYMDMGRLSEAEERYRLALEASPEDESWARAHYGLGRVALEQGRYDQAKESFELALENAQDFFDARVGLGRALYQIGEYEQAIEALELAQLQFPRSVEMLQYLGLAYEAVGRGDQAAHVFSRLEELR